MYGAPAHRSRLNPNDKIVILITGTGFKDMRSAENRIKIWEPIYPEIPEVEKVYKKG